MEGAFGRSVCVPDACRAHRVGAKAARLSVEFDSVRKTRVQGARKRGSRPRKAIGNKEGQTHRRTPVAPQYARGFDTFPLGSMTKCVGRDRHDFGFV